LESSEFAKAQLQQAIETYRTQLSLLVQICTVFVVADATTVGYALQQKFAGVLWVGLVFPIAMLVVMRGLLKMTIPVLATAVSIETRCQDRARGGLVSTFVAVAGSYHFLEQLRSAGMLESESARVKGLAKLQTPILSGGRTVRLLLYLIIAGQALTPIILWRFAGWSLLAK
jgi:hypothetical protein